MPETLSAPPLIAGWRLRALLGVAGLAAAGYLAASLASGGAAVAQAVARVGAVGLGGALALSLLNQALRFVRWQAYVRVLGHRIPTLQHWRIYLSGFAFSVTPGGAGEALRTVFLKRHGVPYTDGLAALLSERISDAAALSLLAGGVLWHWPAARLPLLLAIAAAAPLIVLLVDGGRLQRLHARSAEARGRAGRALHHACGLALRARRCNAPRLLLPATALGMAAWIGEGLGFAWIVHRLGLPVAALDAVFVYCAALLAGAAVPGGVGGVEAALVGLLLLRRAGLAQAIAAAMLIRVVTLWLSVALGVGALASLRRVRGVDA